MTTTTRTPSWLKAVEAAVVAEAEVTRLRNLWQVELRNAERLADENDILQAKLDAVSDQLAGAKQDRNSASARATRLADEKDILQAKKDPTI